MSSDLKIKTARANGAKSRGPATPEGRAKSARNSLGHAAKSVVLPAESLEQFQFLLDAHIQQFHPANPVEMDLVEAMAVARWRLHLSQPGPLRGQPQPRQRAKDAARTKNEARINRAAFRFARVPRAGAFKQLAVLKSQRQNEPKLQPPAARKNALHWPEREVRGGPSCETSSEALLCSQQESSLEHS